MVLTDGVGKSDEVISCAACTSLLLLLPLLMSGALFIDLSHYSVCILEFLKENPYGGSVIIKPAPVSFPFESMDICCQ